MVEKKERLLLAPEVVVAEGKGGEVDGGIDEWDQGCWSQVHVTAFQCLRVKLKKLG